MIQKILDKTEELFYRFGMKAVSMDEIARQMGMSKKTLYQFFDGKSDLIHKSVTYHIEREKKVIEEIHEQSDNAIDEFHRIFDHVSENLSRFNPSVLYDLQKYYPDSWDMFCEYKESFIYNTILHNLQNGVDQKLYRADFHPEIIAKIYLSGMDLILDPHALSRNKYGILLIYEEFVNHYLRGLVTDKGLKLLLAQPLHYANKK